MNSAAGNTASTGTCPVWPAGLRAETGDRDIYRGYQMADALHGNFYEERDVARGHRRLP